MRIRPNFQLSSACTIGSVTAPSHDERLRQVNITLKYLPPSDVRVESISVLHDTKTHVVVVKASFGVSDPFPVPVTHC